MMQKPITPFVNKRKLIRIQAWELAVLKVVDYLHSLTKKLGCGMYIRLSFFYDTCVTFCCYDLG